MPQEDPLGKWQREETLDVEWAHAIAPGAKIDVVECDGYGPFGGLFVARTPPPGCPGSRWYR